MKARNSFLQQLLPEEKVCGMLSDLILDEWWRPKLNSTQTRMEYLADRLEREFKDMNGNYSRRQIIHFQLRHFLNSWLFRQHQHALTLPVSELIEADNAALNLDVGGWTAEQSHQPSYWQILTAKDQLVIGISEIEKHLNQEDVS